jgi:hypothetical protein
MSMEQRLKVSLGLLLAAAACAISSVWAITVQDASLRTLALVPLACSVVLLVIAAYSLMPSGLHIRYRRYHRPLAGPRDGARLPS